MLKKKLNVYFKCMTLMWEARKELTSSKMGELAWHFWIKTTQSEPYSPLQIKGRTLYQRGQEGCEAYYAEDKSIQISAGLLYHISL
jgi:hypothetical protein